MNYLYLLAFLLGFSLPAQSQIPDRKKIISGYVKEKGSDEPLLGVNISVMGTSLGTSTNNYGFYSLTLPEADSLTLTFSYVGYASEQIRIPFHTNRELNVNLLAWGQLQEVQVVADAQLTNSQTPQMSFIQVPLTQIKSIPALAGEKDLLKVLQLMPGVGKGSEGNSALYVRGGGPDQNLIILDDALVYNAYHLFGFFSVFNADAIKSVELTKGGFPARFGGRLSSVVEMTMKEGSKEKLQGEAGIGLISSRLTLEGPLKKEKSSFLLSGRRTYADLLMRPFMSRAESNLYHFYDLNAKANYAFSRKDKLYLSGYFGRDRFAFSSRSAGSLQRSGFNWGNATGTLRWNHLFSEKLFSNLSLIYSNYHFTTTTQQRVEDDEQYLLSYSSAIQDVGIKYDLDYFVSPAHQLKAGLISTFHRFTPQAVVWKDTQAAHQVNDQNNIDVVESGVYLQDLYQPSPKLSILAGMRLSSFLYQQKHYLKAEPRLSLAYRLKEELSLKASYASMNQYVHLLSNTGIGLPTDLWVPATDKVAPQQSKQVALGIANDFVRQGMAVSLEAYYKKSDKIIGYKQGASFLMLESNKQRANAVDWQQNVTSGQGWSYGAELLLQKKTGKLSGWMGYTLSWTLQQFDSLNAGKRFYARYDRRHDLSLVGIYQLTPGIKLSASFVYGTGNALTLPQGEYYAAVNQPVKSNLINSGGLLDKTRRYNVIRAKDFGERNSFRAAAYHRLDLGVAFFKKKRWGERTWELSLYNAYNRQNPFYYFLDDKAVENGAGYKKVLKQISLFPVLPSVSYGVKF